ncbi:MAG: hypothetical protein CL779_00345 [Chloroflexi bacterium]|nr:hypothetical protein [Chloroflexota bacterium]|tara:strand:+ start:476 stop:1240 length:765 start_codon:yes stop_codon:yes gene_type:complete
MIVLEREIGNQLDDLFESVVVGLANMFSEKSKEAKGDSELERKLVILPQDDGLLSRIQWVDDNPYIYLRSDIPTHAIPHILGTALCHVKQRIDQFPDAVKNEDEEEPDGVVLSRMTLKEFVLSLHAEKTMESIDFNMDWEDEQRHQGLKDLLKMLNPEEEDGFNNSGHPTLQFFSLIYAKYSLFHPSDMWRGLSKSIKKDFPAFVQSGEKILEIINDIGYDDIDSCLKCLVDIRDEIAMRPYTLITDRRDGSYY